ncbi:hypothetical protein KSP40_PGU003854 [Platanthera guangdongensis]|uniref:Uncharacterized protein n=1 Tax=Platanthera guangdongensis TaxID=2320717 RepID=A0ABR2N1I1_9ASPA
MHLQISGKNLSTLTELRFCKTSCGLKQVFKDSKTCKNVVRNKFCSAFDMIRSSYLPINFSGDTGVGSCSQPSCKITYPTDEHFLAIVKIYGERILLKESDRKPRVSRRRRERRSSVNTKDREQFETNGDWQGPTAWDPEFGGDGCPKFLCDVMSNPAILSCKSFIAGHALHAPTLFVKYFIALLVKSLTQKQIQQKLQSTQCSPPALCRRLHATVASFLPRLPPAATACVIPKAPESSASPQLPAAVVYLLALILKLLVPPSCKLFLSATLGVYSGKLILHRCRDLPSGAFKRFILAISSP